jgi:hypothetical protein
VPPLREPEFKENTLFPKHYFAEFRTFARSNRVFVAMPFSREFESHWTHVFKPAIGDIDLEPWRVDMRKSGDSIQTEILKEIGQARLVLVDISADSRNRRNPNVMYELGLAHAARLPEEVIIVRGDGKRLPFDFTQIRVHQFDAGKPQKARALLKSLLSDALAEIDLTKDLIVVRALPLLDEDARYLIAMEHKNATFGPYQHIEGRYGNMTWPEVRIILRQLQMPGIVTIEAEIGGESARYAWTDLGRAIIERLKPSFARLGAYQ